MQPAAATGKGSTFGYYAGRNISTTARSMHNSTHTYGKPGKSGVHVSGDQLMDLDQLSTKATHTYI